MKYPKESDIEKRKLLLALALPLFSVIIFWLVKVIELSLDISLSEYGLRPRSFSQWFGIITMPFLHGSLSHLIANTSSFLILGTMLFYFYNKFSLQIIGLSWLIAGVLTWIIGRDSIHIGASGMIYAFAGYIFFGGLLSRDIRLMAISLIVVFMYGSMVWGMMPQNTGISWEGHLAGFLTGIILALIYKPESKSTDFDEDEDDDDDDNYETECRNCTGNYYPNIKYHYKDDK
jgi:membrane associated rhomboid family serine protease